MAPACVTGENRSSFTFSLRSCSLRGVRFSVPGLDTLPSNCLHKETYIALGVPLSVRLVALSAYRMEGLPPCAHISEQPNTPGMVTIGTHAFKPNEWKTIRCRMTAPLAVFRSSASLLDRHHQDALG